MRSGSARRATSLFAFTLALAPAGCRRPSSETRFLNLDPQSSAGALTAGWSGFEKTDAEDTFVWAQARDVRTRVVAGAATDRLLRFRAWPFRWDGAPQQTVTVSVNDVRVGTLPLGEGPRVYSAISPAPAWKDGANVLTFEFAYAETPKDRIPGATDTRTLAAAFDWIEIVPVEPAGSGRK